MDWDPYFPPASNTVQIIKVIVETMSTPIVSQFCLVKEDIPRLDAFGIVLAVPAFCPKADFHQAVDNPHGNRALFDAVETAVQFGLFCFG